MEKPTGRRASDVDVIVKHARNLGGGIQEFRDRMWSRITGDKDYTPVTNRKCNRINNGMKYVKEQ